MYQRRKHREASRRCICVTETQTRSNNMVEINPDRCWCSCKIVISYSRSLPRRLRVLALEPTEIDRMSSSVPPTDCAKLLSLERGAEREERPRPGLGVAEGGGVAAAGRAGVDRAAVGTAVGTGRLGTEDG